MMNPAEQFPAMASDDPQRFLLRELSSLAFNQRVIEEASNIRHPLLERLNFLAISSSNLDEFVVVHMAAIEAKYQNQPAVLANINAEISRILELHQKIWVDLTNSLRDAGLYIIKPSDLDADDRSWLSSYFHLNIYPALTPLAIDTVHPFPFIPNGGVAIALDLFEANQNKNLRAVIPLPPPLPRFIRLPASNTQTSIRFVMLEDIVQNHLQDIFPTLVVREASVFRVLRDTEIHITESAPDDFMGSFESAIKKRYYGAIVRLSVVSSMSTVMRDFLADQLDVSLDKTVVRSGFMRFSDARQLMIKDRPDLVYTPYEPRFPERIREFNGDCFAAIAQKDILVHHPFESFDVVVQFILQAAQDPNVVAIKQTLYRTSSASPIVKALVAAAEAGKSVTVMVELKARFDEEANIRWARDLEKAGAHVVFGFMDMKTHAKMTLVIRRENSALRSYAHFGTGNYHPDTARVYTDLSFFTCDTDLCQDAAAVFNYMTGYAQPTELRKLKIAPLYLRHNVMQLIDNEIAHVRAGRIGQIWLKMNALVDPVIIDKLYQASTAGVSIDLIIRGACCLRPGVPGLSENIRVKSIVGRFLEHSRILAFGNGQALPHAKAKVFLSSADWMTRNFDRRIETLVPIENETVHAQIVSQILPACLMDTRQSWELSPDGIYHHLPSTVDDFCAHDYFMTNPSLSGRGTNLDQKILPQPLPYEQFRKKYDKDDD
jgi:polyphosphate kinase